MTSDSFPHTVLVRDLRGYGETRQRHARAARRGAEVRVARRAYVNRAEWDAPGRREQQLLRLRAFAGTRATPPIFSHWSAALLHGFPFAAERGGNLHIAVGPTAGGRSTTGVRARSVRVPDSDTVDVDGLRCTSPARTAVDIAATCATSDAVAVADHVVGEHGREPLLAAWLQAQPLRGHRRAMDVIAFADGGAQSPLESLSRVVMYEAGMPKPELQRPFHDARGLIGYADFAWPALRILGEADGDAKYLDAGLRGGRTAERVVLDEKIREDRLRALGWKVVRWRWPAVREPQRLTDLLTAAGLPADPRRRWDDCGIL